MDLSFLFDLARSLNRHAVPAPLPLAPAADAHGDRPGDDFNRKGSWEDVLRPAGWEVGRRAGETLHWRRPGKKPPGTSATTGRCRSEASGDLLYVFSTNAAPFEAERCYSKFGAFALLHHAGDFGAAARELREKGYGAAPVKGARAVPGRNGEAAPAKPCADNSDDPLDQDATAADLIRMDAVIRWAWEGWIPLGVLTILASEPGIGKTRFCGDLLRRVYHALPWPDGKAATHGPGGVVLWIPADNQHAELGSLPAAFGFPPEALYLNATRRNPFVGTMLDEEADLKDFEARIARVKPALVFVDTSLNATDRTSHKPEDAKAFFKPLQEIAARQGVALMCVTHLNAGGRPLGRRIEGQGRSVIMLERPDPEGQPNRRKLYVRKSHSLYPPPLGVTMKADGNDYDGDPPRSPEKDAPARVITGPDAGPECRDWLADRMARGPQPVQKVRAEAETVGFTAGTLYRARGELRLEEYREGGKKWWRFPRPEDLPPEDDS
jgi:hypothetical protein